MRYFKSKENLLNWLQVMRMSQGFFFISAMPVFISHCLLAYHYPKLDLNIFSGFVVLLICVLFHLGADMINEYYDYIKGNHEFVAIKTPFNGGTGILDRGKLPAKSVLIMSYVFFALGLTFSGYLLYVHSIFALIFILAGLFSSWAYSVPPFQLSYRGLGEILIFLNNGFFVMGLVFILYLDSNSLLLIVLPSLVLGFLGLSIIITNQIPDYEADKRVNKKNFVVLFGKSFSLILVKIFICLSLVSLVLCLLFKIFPYECSLSLIPFYKNKKIFRYKLNDFLSYDSLFLVCKSVLSLKLEVSSFIFAGFLLSLFIGV